MNERYEVLSSCLPLSYDIRERLINKHSASQPTYKSTKQLTD
jgi:hypothetical protein